MLRKVMFKINERDDYNLKGLFHQWCISDGDTFAIIECEDGKITLVHPWEVMFINES